MSDKGPIRLHDLSKKGGERTSTANIQNVNKSTDRSLNESIARTVAQTRHSDTQRLTAAERARLLTGIDGHKAEQDAQYTSDRTHMRAQSEADRGYALNLQEAILVRTNERTAWAMTEINNRIAAETDAMARVAGSSHNCYVQNMTLNTVRDAMNQQASILADMDIRGLQAEVEARDRTFREGVASRLESNDRLLTHKQAEWGLLKDALMTHDEQQNTQDDTSRVLTESINENTLITGFQLSGRGYAEDTTDNAGSYAGDAGSYAADVSRF